MKNQKETLLLTTLLRWETSSRKSSKSIFLVILKRGEGRWAVEEGGIVLPLQDPVVVPRILLDQEENIGNTRKASIVSIARARVISKSTVIYIEGEVLLHRGQNLDLGQEMAISLLRARNHTSNLSFSKTTSGIVLVESLRKMNMEISSLTTVCTRRSTRQSISWMRLTEEWGCKSWERMQRGWMSFVGMRVEEGVVLSRLRETMRVEWLT